MTQGRGRPGLWRRAAGCLAAALAALAASGDVVLENARLRLTLGDDAVVKSLVVKPSGEECVDASMVQGECPEKGE